MIIIKVAPREIERKGERKSRYIPSSATQHTHHGSMSPDLRPFINTCNSSFLMVTELVVMCDDTPSIRCRFTIANWKDQTRWPLLRS